MDKEKALMLLGVTESITKVDLRKLYRSLAKENHPDRNKGKSSELFIQLTKAYTLLKDLPTEIIEVGTYTPVTKTGEINLTDLYYMYVEDDTLRESGENIQSILRFNLR